MDATPGSGVCPPLRIAKGVLRKAAILTPVAAVLVLLGEKTHDGVRWARTDLESRGRWHLIKEGNGGGRLLEEKIPVDADL